MSMKAILWAGTISASVRVCGGGGAGSASSSAAAGYPPPQQGTRSNRVSTATAGISQQQGYPSRDIRRSRVIRGPRLPQQQRPYWGRNNWINWWSASRSIPTRCWPR